MSTTPEALPWTPTDIEVFVGFEIGKFLTDQVAELTRAKLSVDSELSSSLREFPIPERSSELLSTDLPDGYDYDELARLSLVASIYRTRRFQKELRLSERQTEMERRFSGLPVTVASVSGDRIIVPYYWPSGLDAPGRYESRGFFGPYNKARGTVTELLLGDNKLRIKPHLFSIDRADHGYYETPVLDEDGEPLINISFGPTQQLPRP